MLTDLFGVTCRGEWPDDVVRLVFPLLLWALL